MKSSYKIHQENTISRKAFSRGLTKKGIKKWANNISANFSHFHSCNESLSTFRQSEYLKCSSLPFTTRDFDHALIRSVVKAKGNKHERREVQGTLLPTGAAGKIKASKTINKAGFCFVWVFFQKQMLGGSRPDRMSS